MLVNYGLLLYDWGGEVWSWLVLGFEKFSLNGILGFGIVVGGVFVGFGGVVLCCVYVFIFLFFCIYGNVW